MFFRIRELVLMGLRAIFVFGKSVLKMLISALVRIGIWGKDL